MSHRTLITALVALVAAAVFAIPATASARTGAIVFSMASQDHRVYEDEGEVLPPKDPEGGIFAVRNRNRNQLTENPADAEPSFSRDGRMIAFVRNGDVFAMRADGSGLRRLTGGPEIDGRPLIAPNGRYLVFERQTAAGGPHSLYTVRTNGGPSHLLVGSAFGDEHEATFAPNGRRIVFVRSSLRYGNSIDNLVSVRPNGTQRRRLTKTTRIDEWAPRYVGGRVVFSRGVRADDESGYADVYSVRWDGRKLRKMIAGAGSAYVDDVAANGRKLLFHRKGGLWLKKLGGRSRLLVPLADEVEFNAVFDTTGRKVALYQATEDPQSISIVDVVTGRVGSPQVRAFPEDAAISSEIGRAIAWQPVLPRR